MRTSSTPPEPEAAETTRRTTTCTRRRRGHEFLINSGSTPGLNSLRPAKRLDNTRSPIRNQQSRALAVPSKYNEIPTARIALNNVLSRYSTHNNAYSRNSENAAPIAQYNEMAPASSCSFVRFVVRKGPASASRLHLSRSRSIQPYLGLKKILRDPGLVQRSPRACEPPGSSGQVLVHTRQFPRSGSTIRDHRFAISNPAPFPFPWSNPPERIGTLCHG
jgi:hypothetical protein